MGGGGDALSLLHKLHILHLHLLVQLPVVLKQLLQKHSLVRVVKVGLRF